MHAPTPIEPPSLPTPAGALPLDAVHTRERQFTRIFTTMYGQKHRARTRLPVKTQAVRMHEAGGPEALRVEDIWVPDPGATEVRIAQKAVGLNFLDTYQRRGLFPSPGLPWVIGFEGAGVVESVGGAVTALREGDRVAYANAPPGAYAGLRTIAADAVVKLPDAIGFEQAAATMLKGMTAEYLVHKSGKVQPGDTVLVHAAAGGTGLLLCQWLAHRGAIVIGCVGDDDKRALAESHGCRHAVDYRREDVVARVAEITCRAAARALPWSMIPSAATRPRPPSPAFAPAARSCSTAARRAPSLSMSSRQRRINPSRSCAPASSRRTPRPPRFRTGRGKGAFRGAGERRGGGPYRPALCARRCGRGAPRHRSEAHHRPERSNSWIAPRRVERTRDMHYHGAANILSRGHGSYS